MESFDHIPTPAELAQLYAREEANDPRSVFYKRTLVRPKLRPALLLPALLAVALLEVGLWSLVRRWLDIPLSILVCLCALIVPGVVFPRRILISAVKLYQALAPAKLRLRCRYEPSCSAYMILSVEKYGFWKGLRKGLRRWRSCKPPNGGYDLP